MTDVPTTEASRSASARTWVTSMRARGPEEPHRAATPLELFFDLCFVVAVAEASSSLHETLGHGAIARSLLGYATVFFAIWWAWMNFTWFASAYDNDDVPYRLAVLVQIAGALILAAGVPRAFRDHDWAVIAVGYAVMRLALVSLWVRAARGDPERRRTDLRYALGVSVCMAGWAGVVAVPDRFWPFGFLVMAVAELLVPVWAEAGGTTTSWHPGHITERYGLFTLIVLGESVAAATIALQSALDSGIAFADLAEIAGAGLLIVCSMWWLYFSQPAERAMQHARSAFGRGASRESFIWGYGHYLVFSSAAAVGAGLVVAIDDVIGKAEVSSRTATLSVAIPVAAYVLSVSGLHSRVVGSTTRLFVALGIAALVVGVAFVGLPVIAIGLLLVVLVAASVLTHADAVP